MNLLALPAFADNYIWMLHDGERAVVVDPGAAAPVQQALRDEGLVLAGILVTHHHPDHVGGVDELRPLLQGPVWGPARETIPQPCTPLAEGDGVDILGLTFEVMDVPGHTAGHIAYVQQGAGDEVAPLLFCGDTLFSAGCGRLFEGTPGQMHASLSKLAALPPATRVCCAHEYTLSNLRFAAAVDPGNADLAAHENRCRSLRASGLATLPSTIGTERDVNPFLRCHRPEVADAVRSVGADVDDGDAVAVFTALRAWKDRYR